MAVISQEINTRTDIPKSFTYCEEFECKRVSAGRDAEWAVIVHALKGTVHSASRPIGTKGCIPCVTGIATCSARRGMGGAEVCVEYNCAPRLCLAGASCAFLPGESRVDLCHLCAHLLGIHNKKKGESYGYDFWDHESGHRVVGWKPSYKYQVRWISSSYNCITAAMPWRR